MRKPTPAPTTRRRTPLVIRCTGRAVNPRTFQPFGRTCGQVFSSAAPYRSRANWIERARAAGWRVSPLKPDKTVTAHCPTCHTGRPKNRKDPTP